MPQNSEVNQKFGVYKSVCCGSEIVIGAGTIFPDCPNHPRLTTMWKLLPDSENMTDKKKSESEPAA